MYLSVFKKGENKREHLNLFHFKMASSINARNSLPSAYYFLILRLFVLDHVSVEFQKRNDEIFVKWHCSKPSRTLVFDTRYCFNTSLNLFDLDY